MSIFPFSMHIVRGHSMQPSIKDGSRVVAFVWAYLFSRPKVGDIVVFRGNDNKEYVKRVVVANKNEFVVEGDNKEDSKKLLPISKDMILGKVVLHYLLPSIP